jgi:hypothetical protein
MATAPFVGPGAIATGAGDMSADEPWLLPS